MVGTTLTLEVESDGQAPHTVNLASLQDGTGTDDQQVDNFSLVGTTLTLEVESDGQAPHTVNLASLQDGTGTDDQQVDNFSLTGTTLTLEVESDGQAPHTVNLASLQDGTGTDDQQVDNFSLVGTTLTLEVESDGQAPHTVNLASLQDGTGTDDQQVDNFSLSGTVLTLEIEDDGQAPQTVNLASLQDGTGTDDQNLTLGAGTTSTSIIDMENGNDIIIQAGNGITLNESGNTLTIDANTSSNPNPTANLRSTGCECENTFDSLNILTPLLPVNEGDPFNDIDLDSTTLKNILNQNVCYIPLRISGVDYTNAAINIQLPKSGNYQGKRFKLFIDIRSSSNIGLQSGSGREISVWLNKEIGVNVMANHLQTNEDYFAYGQNDFQRRYLRALSGVASGISQGELNYTFVICLYDAGDYWIITDEGEIWEE